MRETFRRILDPEKQLRERLFQLLSTIALAEYIIVSVYGLVTGDSGRQIAVMLTGMVLFACTVSYTFRSGRMRAGAAVSGLLYFLIYPLTFFSSGGMYGGAPPVFAFALVYVFLVTQKWERTVTLAACVLGSGACFLIALRRPELLMRHTVTAEHAESFLSILLVTLLLCMLFTFVTEVYRAENRIVQRQKKEIEALHQSQKRFFSSMSHEIRTPVNAIIGFNEMTLRENISDEVRENALSIEAASRTLLHTINEILDLSKLETSGMEILPAEYRVADMLGEIANMVRQQAREKGLDFSVRIDPRMPSALIGDEVRIRQILLNLLTNAVKYTRTGSVILSVSGSTDGTGVFRAAFAVKDTGIGIREESIPLLFSAFQRVDEANTHAIEGTGLGLTIVKDLLDLMGGSVTVESEYGKGSCFRAEIPQRIADAAPVGEIDLLSAPKTASERYESALTDRSLRILAVDDTPMNLMVVKKLLRDIAAVDTAPDGAEALRLTGKNAYDVILMDHQMPGMDGIECLHRIRTQENGLCRDSRVVCLTANVGPDMENLCRDAGFDGYLAKPVRGKSLEAELLRLTETHIAPENSAPSIKS